MGFQPDNDASTNAQGLVGVIKMIAEMYGDEVHGVGFIAENSEWGQSQMASFIKYFEEAGIQVAYQEFYEAWYNGFHDTGNKNEGGRCTVSDPGCFRTGRRAYPCTDSEGM